MYINFTSVFVFAYASNFSHFIQDQVHLSFKETYFYLKTLIIRHNKNQRMRRHFPAVLPPPSSTSASHFLAPSLREDPGDEVAQPMHWLVQ